MKRLQRGPAAVLVLLSGPALASVETVGGGVSLSQTRVVYLATDKAQLLTVKNTGQQYRAGSCVHRTMPYRPRF